MNTTKQLLGAVVLALSTAAASAQEGPATVFSPTASTLSRAEVIADLHLWQRAGMDKFVGVEGAEFTTPQYERALAAYTRLRNGPEFLAEVQRVAEKQHRSVAAVRSVPSVN